MKGGAMLHTMTSKVVSPDDGFQKLSLVWEGWGRLMGLVVNLGRDHHEQNTKQLSRYKAQHTN
jgi:hypothetical protein